MKLKTVAKITTFSLITTMMTYASSVDTSSPCGIDEKVNYHFMSTEHIEYEVENTVMPETYLLN